MPKHTGDESDKRPTPRPPAESMTRRESLKRGGIGVLSALIGGVVGSRAMSNKPARMTSDQVSQIYMEIYSAVDDQLPALEELEQKAVEKKIQLSKEAPSAEKHTPALPHKNVLAFLGKIAALKQQHGRLEPQHDRNKWEHAMSACETILQKNVFIGKILQRLADEKELTALKDHQHYKNSASALAPGVLFGEGGKIENLLTQLMIALKNEQKLPTEPDIHSSVAWSR